MKHDDMEAAVGAALASLDFSAENAEVEALQRHIAANEAAIAKAQARQAEIGQLLAQGAGPDGRAVADALLSEADAQIAAFVGPDRAALQSEAASLSAAVKELHARNSAAHGRMKEAHEATARKAAEVVAPLVDAEIGAAREAAERLAEAFVKLEAIWYATRAGTIEAAMTRTAVKETTGFGKLVSWRRTRPVPESIRKALSALADRGPAVNASLPAEIIMP